MGAYKLVAISDWAKRHTQGGSCDLVLPSGRTASEPMLLGRNVPLDAGHVRYPASWAHISSRHAKLFADKTDEGTERWSVMDTSTNGTFVNDVRIPQGTSVDLKPGDKLRLSVPSKAATGGVIEYEFVYDENHQEPQSLPYTGNKRKTASTGQQQSSPGVKRNRSTSPSHAPEASLHELQRLAAKNEELRGQAAAYRQQIDTLERQLSESEAAKDALKHTMEQNASKALRAQQEASAAAAAQLDAASAATAAADARAAESDARTAQAEQASAAAAAEAAAASEARAALEEQLHCAQAALAQSAALMAAKEQQFAAQEQAVAAAHAARDAATSQAAEAGAELARIKAALAAAEAVLDTERDASARAARDASRALASAERRAASAAERLDTERERRLVQGRAARASAAAAKDVMAEQLRQWEALVAGGQERFRQLGVLLEGMGMEQEEDEEGGGVSVEGDGGVQTSEAHADYQQTQAFSHHQALQHSDAGQAGNHTPRSHGRRSDAGMEATLIIGQAPVPMDLGAGGSVSQEEQLQEAVQQQQQQQQQGEEEEEEQQHMQQDQHVDEEADAACMQQDAEPVERQEEQLQANDNSQARHSEASPAAAEAEQDASAKQPLQQGQQEDEATPEGGMAASADSGGHGFQSGSAHAANDDGNAEDAEAEGDAEDADGQEEEEQQQQQQGFEGDQPLEDENAAAKPSSQRTPGSALADNTNRAGGDGLGSEDGDYNRFMSGKGSGFALEAGQRGETLALLSGLPAGEMEGDENAMQD